MYWITAQDLDSPSSPYAEEAVQAASYILWQLSGRRFAGLSTSTEIYRSTPSSLDDIIALSVSGGMVNVRCSGCGATHCVWLRQRPVRDIVELTVDGAVVPSNKYILLDRNRIVPSSPTTCWGTSTADIVVTYTHGAEVPAAGLLAAKELANQILYSASNDDRCRLPDRVTSISRQGVSWTIIDPQDFLDKGRTGLYLVDLFLKTVNPTGSRVRARVFSPDIRTAGKIARPVPNQPSGSVLTVTALRGDPFTTVLGYATEDVIVVQITAHSGASWEIPQRMLVRNGTTGIWSLVGTLPQDTSLVPNKALIDVFGVDGTAITHLSTRTIFRAGSTSDGDNYSDPYVAP
jgi:hypothetical protein